MSAIYGVIFNRFDKRKEEIREKEFAIREMGRILHRRGPGGTKVFSEPSISIGCNHFSRKDNDSISRSFYEDGRFVVICDSDIYNHPGSTPSIPGQNDARMFAEIYQKSGSEGFAGINGIFAVALWDKKERALVLARDPMGIKPLYYTCQRNNIIFASEIKAIVKVAGFPGIDYRSIQDYFIFQCVLGEKTFFRGIQKVMPGSYVKFRDGIVSKGAFHEFEFQPDMRRSEEYFVRNVRDLMCEAVRMRVTDGAKLGFLLSGGMDSSAVACFASRILGRVLTFSGIPKGEKELDESFYSDLVAEKIKSRHYKVAITPKLFPEVLPGLIEALDEPVAGPALYSQYIVSCFAGKKAKILVSGQGGDELFGGYARYYMLYLEQALIDVLKSGRSRKGFDLNSLAQNLEQLRDYLPLMSRSFMRQPESDLARRYFGVVSRSSVNWFAGDLFKSGYSTEEEYTRIFSACKSISILDRLEAFELQTLAQGLLQVEDRINSLLSLEERMPLLDLELARFSMTIPEHIKFRGGRMKYVMRRAVEGIVPAQICSRKNKMGFPLPIGRWFSGPLNGYLRDVLLSRTARSRGIYNIKNISGLLEPEQARKSSREIWGLLCLELWFRMFSTPRND